MDKSHIPAATLVPLQRVPKANVAPGIRIPRFIRDVEAGRVELPTIPRVVQRLTMALGAAEIDFRYVSKQLARDPVLSAKVLRLANSPVLGGQRTVASIEAAVGMIGVDALNKLVLAGGVAVSLEGIAGIDLRAFWHDALVTAVAANKVAPLLGADPDQAYLCGLLHATGHLILCSSYPDIAAAMFAGFALARGAERAAIEIEAFGIDHATAGALWVESLGFPPAVVETLSRQAQPPGVDQTPLDTALRSGCALATAAVRKKSAVAALHGLAPALRDRLIHADGKPNAGFCTFFEALRKIRPMF